MLPKVHCGGESCPHIFLSFSRRRQILEHKLDCLALCIWKDTPRHWAWVYPWLRTRPLLLSTGAAYRLRIWPVGWSAKRSNDLKRIPRGIKHPQPIIISSLNVNVSFIYVWFSYSPGGLNHWAQRPANLSSHPAEQWLHKKRFPVKYQRWRLLFC